VGLWDHWHADSWICASRDRNQHLRAFIATPHDVDRYADCATHCHISCRARPERTCESTETGLTKANYLRIQTGMTYAEVIEILGEPGEELSRNELAGTTTIMYAWKRWTGANMNALFQNGRLVQKAQFGLDWFPL
jgi:hypothetical protein